MIKVLKHTVNEWGLGHSYWELEVGDSSIFCIVQRDYRGKWSIHPDTDFGLRPCEAREVADWCDQQEAALTGGAR